MIPIDGQKEKSLSGRCHFTSSKILAWICRTFSHSSVSFWWRRPYPAGSWLRCWTWPRWRVRRPAPRYLHLRTSRRSPCDPSRRRANHLVHIGFALMMSLWIPSWQFWGKSTPRRRWTRNTISTPHNRHSQTVLYLYRIYRVFPDPRESSCIDRVYILNGSFQQGPLMARVRSNTRRNWW